VADIRFEEWSAALADQVEDLLYAFNVEATGISDGRGLALVMRGEDERILAAAIGHTWGETCELKQVWVDASLRRRGLGRELLSRAIAEAEARGCSQLVLSTHDFQAPDFYTRLGFQELFRVREYPRGHASIHLRRQLNPRRGAMGV
jgi:ribosomal protein S18 acetylase RimI-like enzyme